MTLENLKKQLGNVVEQYIAPFLLPVVERNIVPDFLIRNGIRLMLADRLRMEENSSVEDKQAKLQAFVNELKSHDIAIHTKDANTQHYEVPSEFYQIVLGPKLKYSSGLWPRPNTTFEESEVEMLESYCKRARLADGQTVLDLGCGWGSCCLYVAAKYPRSNVFALSNSRTQKEFIDSKAKERGICNLTVVTRDISSEAAASPFPADVRFDRIISIEMFEHMKNYDKLLERVSSWMKPSALLFVHIFVHKTYAYHFENGWMAENFFTGGTMPSQDLLLYFQKNLAIVDTWSVNGTNYGKTSEAWLQRLDANESEVRAIFRKHFSSEKDVTKQIVNWRLFFLACAELFNYEQGNQWHVAHYLFEKK